MDIIKLLKKYPFVSDTEVIQYLCWEKGYYFKIKVLLTNTTILFITEYLDEEEKNYSYHWQKSTGKLISRWDNSPHHKNILTFPHHKHTSDGNILESREITLDDVLNWILKHLAETS